MQITMLGTSCMVPTKERNVSSFFLSFQTEGILFDCGEGTQRQMNITGIKRTKVTKILITHWHGDHVAGIPGLLQTIANNEEPPTVDIYGPQGTKEKMELLQKVFVTEAKVKLRVHDLDPEGIQRFFEDDDFALECAYMKHGTKTLGYSFIEKDRRRINTDYLNKIGVKDGPHLKKLQKGQPIEYKGKKIDVDDATYIVEGKKITYVPDTRPCNNAIELAEMADVLIIEATYTTDMEEKARAYKHLTAREAAWIANQAGVKQLVLTHFSQRFKNSQQIEEDARDIFDKIICAEDFMKIKP